MLIDRLPEHRSIHIRAMLLAAGIALGGLLAPDAGHAQYHSRPVKLMVTVAPGGGPDTIARVIGERLSPLLGQPVVVENRAGSNGNIAMELVAKSAPDGYSVVICADSMIVINPHMYAKMPIDTLKDLTPIATVASNTFFLSVHPSVPVKTFQEFVEYAKTANPPLAYGSGGNGSQQQMAMEMLKVRAGINLVHVPYKGGAPALVDLAAGRVQLAFANVMEIMPYITSGKLRPLATTGMTRAALLPDVPTIAEAGYKSIESFGWFALLAPRGTPKDIISRLNTEITGAQAQADVKKRLYELGVEALVGSPADAEHLIRGEIAKWTEVIREAGIKPDD